MLFASALLGLFAYSIVLNLGVFQRDVVLPPDSPAFLEVVDLLNGRNHGTVAPLRTLYPVYPYLAWAVGKFVIDGILAARIAAGIPVLFCPFLVILACRMLGYSRPSSWMAGFLLASWAPLTGVARVPLYDSTFVCMTAASLVCVLAALQSRSMRAFLGAGCVCGIAAATRGPGLFFPVALLIPLWVARDQRIGRKVLLTVAAVLSFAAAMQAARFPAARMASNLLPDKKDCVRQVIADGILYSEGTRDHVVLSLAANCADFDNPTMRACALTWPQFTREYGLRWMKMAARNWKRLLFRDLVGIFFPFLLFCAPLSFAFHQGLKNGSPGFQPFLVLLLFALPFLVIVPALQMQERYFYPLIVVVCVLVGYGFDLARRSLTERGNRLLLAGCLGVGAFAGLDGLRQNTEPDPVAVNYRAACNLILKSPDYREPANVMARTSGVYAHFGSSVAMMPVASPDRLICNARAHHERFFIYGPNERLLNPWLSSDRQFPGLQEMQTFGKAPDSVEVFRIQD